MKKIILAASIAVPFAVAYAQDKPLSADEIKTLVSGKILEYPEDAQGVSRNQKLDADGTGIGTGRSSRDTLSASLKWRVTDKDEFCTHVQQAGWTESCTLVQKTPDGSYARVRDGMITSTFTVR